MLLEHNKIYVSRDGRSIVRIRKEKWDCTYQGFSVHNNVYMGCYSADGRNLVTAHEQEPNQNDLIAEVVAA